jgi:hypothetical protein
MVASVTHLVIGERVLREIDYLSAKPEVCPAFLAGCILVDLHAFQPVDRRLTHFVGRVEEDGEAAFRKSCSIFLTQLDSILKAPWERLSQTSQAFVSGYLCHLAVDECWKKLGWELFQTLGISDWADFPFPSDVSLTAFDFLASKQSPDFETASRRLENIQPIDVFTHIPPGLLIRQWEIIQFYVLSGATPEEYVRMLRLAGKSEDEIRASEQRHKDTFNQAIEWYRKYSLVEPFIDESVQHSLKMLTRIWIEK